MSLFSQIYNGTLGEPKKFFVNCDVLLRLISFCFQLKPKITEYPEIKDTYNYVVQKFCEIIISTQDDLHRLSV